MSARIEAIRDRRKTRELMASLRSNPWCGGPYINYEPQKTLRDEFAAAALTGLLHAETAGDYSNEHVASISYLLADAMLAARASTKGAA